MIKSILAAVAVSLLVVTAAVPALAQAVVATVAAPESPATQIESGIADIVMTLGGILATLVVAWLKRKFNIDMENSLRNIEATHRDALHSAVQTAVGAAWAKWGPKLSFDPNSQSGQFITNAVKAGAPEAVDVLKATDSWILSAAASKLALSTADTSAINAFATTVKPNPNPPAPVVAASQ